MNGPIPSTETMAPWHRRLLTAAAVFLTLLIAAGGVLCVTGSIRSCPDWPGCFGRVLPPLEASPILEITHRGLAATTGLLVLVAAVSGAVRSRRSGWVFVAPIIAILLLVEVSYFGARVVLEGISPFFAAVDVGSALLATALMVTAAVLAQGPQPARMSFGTPRAKLALAAVLAVYAVLVSGVLAAGTNSLTGCLGWPLYSRTQVGLSGPGAGVRLGVSVLAAGLVVWLLVRAWRERRMARWVALAFALEALLQAAILVFGGKVALLVPYTITMAALWAGLVALAAVEART